MPRDEGAVPSVPNSSTPADLIWSRPDWAWATERAATWTRPATNSVRKSFIGDAPRVWGLEERPVIQGALQRSRTNNASIFPQSTKISETRLSGATQAAPQGDDVEQRLNRRKFMMAAAGAAALAGSVRAGRGGLRLTPGGGSITQVPGLKVGHYTDTRRPTGCTVIIAEAGATADARRGARHARDRPAQSVQHGRESARRDGRRQRVRPGRGRRRDALPGRTQDRFRRGRGPCAHRAGGDPVRPGRGRRLGAAGRGGGLSGLQVRERRPSPGRQRRRRRRRHGGQAVRSAARHEGRHRQRR